MHNHYMLGRLTKWSLNVRMSLIVIFTAWISSFCANATELREIPEWKKLSLMRSHSKPIDAPYGSLQEIVSAYNQLRYSGDIIHDNWKPSHITLKVGFGDCEDLAIAAMDMVNASGLGKAVVAIVKTQKGEHHAVALIQDKPNGHIYMLDNFKGYLILWNGVDEYTPIFYFNQKKQSFSLKEILL